MIDSNTTLVITNPHTQASGIYQISYLTEYANLEPIAKTEDIYKQIIDKVLDTYDIQIHGSRIAKEWARGRTKELLKDLVTIIIDRYYDLFNKIAEELNLC